MIKLEHVDKYFGDLHVLKDVNLEVAEGEKLVIIGPSGSGKSTTVRCMNFLEEPTSGHIWFDGVDIADKSVNIDLHRQKMGMVFQHFNIFPHMSVIDNITLAPVLLKKASKDEAIAKAESLLARVGLSDKRDNKPSRLSGGQKQRLAIARALAMEPEVMLFDEPTSALDPDATEAILNLLRDLNRKLGLTIVLITHEMAVIKSICNRVAVMENGRVVEEGDVYDIFAHPRAAITRKFVSSASALSKVHKLMEEGSPLVKPDAHEKLVRLTFHRECVGEHVISTISRDFGVDVNIVLANVEVLEDNPLGGVIALLGGREEQVQSALQYLNENHVYTEVIADGSV